MSDPTDNQIATPHALIEGRVRTSWNGSRVGWGCTCGARIWRTRGANAGGVVYARGNARLAHRRHVAVAPHRRVRIAFRRVPDV